MKILGVYLKYAFLGISSGALAYAWRPQSTLGTAVQGLLWCSAVGNCIVAVLFKLEKGAKLLGKSSKTGRIPWWSYAFFFWFHLPTIAYTYLQHTREKPEEYATEVYPRLFLGGRYANFIPERSPEKPWLAIVDLTCEFPPAGHTDNYLLCATWDGTPPPTATVEQAARFVAEQLQAKGEGDILVHCAHGKGRSTMIMCASLVTAGLAGDWKEAFAMCKAKRPQVKLNSRMQSALTKWSKQFS